MAENGNENVIGYEEGTSRLLPANAFDQQQSCLREKVFYSIFPSSAQKLRYQKHHQSKRHHSKSPAADNSHWRCSQLRNQRTRNGTSSSNTKWAIGGPGMQAVFLDSGQRSCGTGVFIPRREGTHFPSSNRPACPPVLLPSRVVQALNLNVHELGFQKQERTSKQSNAGGVDCGLLGSKKENINASAGVGSGGSQCCSPEIFLPKEWTY